MININILEMMVHSELNTRVAFYNVHNVIGIGRLYMFICVCVYVPSMINWQIYDTWELDWAVHDARSCISL